MEMATDGGGTNQVGPSTEAVSASDNSSNYVSCTICNKLFLERKYLEKHFRFKHPDVKEPKIKENLCEDDTNSTSRIQCAVCGLDYDNMTEYTHHLKTHLTTVKDENFQKVSYSFS